MPHERGMMSLVFLESPGGLFSGEVPPAFVSGARPGPSLSFGGWSPGLCYGVSPVTPRFPGERQIF